MIPASTNQLTCQSVDEVLVTHELDRRPARKPQYELENRALLSLAQEIATRPQGVLHKLAELTMQLCQADSAGVSILEPEKGGEVFRSPAIVGPFSAHVRESIPRHNSPWGVVLERNRVLLFKNPERFFLSLRTIHPHIGEALLAPWEVNGRLTGTLWAVSHRPEREFDREDARVLRNLAHFASAAFGLMDLARVNQELRAQRSAALNLMEDAVQSREALVRSQERLRLVLENAREYAIFSMDLERRISSWNPGAERILGYTEREILGQSGDVIFTAEDQEAGDCHSEVQTALVDGRATDERWHVRKDGSRFWGSGAMTAMHNPNGATVGFVKILRDETEAKRIEDALKQSRAELEVAFGAAQAARKEAEAANRAKDMFLAMLSHELRTPLTPVLMAAETILRRNDLSPRIREALEMIARNIEVETRFVDDLLDLTRIARGKLELSRQPLDVHDVVRRAAEVVATDVQANQQTLEMHLHAPCPTVHGDFLRLQQAFWNLLKNASKFTPPGGKIQVTSRNEGPHTIVIDVSDTGRGIQAGVLQQIFEPFQQGGEAIAREFGGLGLGLAIAQAVAHGHEGVISARSAGPSQGATFTVQLPILPPSPAVS